MEEGQGESIKRRGYAATIRPKGFGGRGRRDLRQAEMKGAICRLREYESLARK